MIGAASQPVSEAQPVGKKSDALALRTSTRH